ncbi:hypothetical protein XENOCAPTIV_009223 [Xenoophorus captivus]|uniref:Secreted protein n=1 Tax=Xenoophorus captivus TaxID=1517983 RepID=A0ABV0SF73_9TELE
MEATKIACLLFAFHRLAAHSLRERKTPARSSRPSRQLRLVCPTHRCCCCFCCCHCSTLFSVALSTRYFTICPVVKKLCFLKKEKDDNHSTSFINLALRETGLSASDVLLSRPETKSDETKADTSLYHFGKKNPCGLVPPLGRAEVGINLNFHADILAPLQQIVC